MAFIVDEEYIKGYLGDIVYDRGRDMYLRNKVRRINIMENSQNIFSVVATVESAYDLKDYKVNILTNIKNGSLYTTCTCEAYSEYKSCKHIAAVLIKLSRDEFQTKGSIKVLNNYGVELIEMLKEDTENIYKPQELVRLEIIVQITNAYSKSYSIELKIGTEKLYVVKSIKDFMESLFISKKAIYFGKDFTLEPKNQYFSESDEEVIIFLKELYDINEKVNEVTYNNKGIFLSGKKAYLTESQLMKLLKVKDGQYINANLKGRDFSNIQIKYEDIPLNFNISLSGDKISLNVEEALPEDVDIKSKLFIYKDKLYIPSQRQLAILGPIYKMMKRQKTNSIEFIKDQIQDLFTYVIPQVKLISKSLSLDEELKNVVEEEPLKIQFYLDKEKHNEFITCRIVFNYRYTSFTLEQNTKKQNNKVIIRNLEEEKRAVVTLEAFGFKRNKELLELNDEEKIMDFITLGLESISKLGEVYYSDSFKNINILSPKNFKSSISLSNNNLLQLDFEVEGINRNELKELFNSLRYKKKYHKFKNGSIIPLYSKEFQEFNNLGESLDLDLSKVAKGAITIPKYAALYLDDKIRNSNLNFISRNEEFKALIKTINEIKYANYKIPNKLTGILRDYQKVGFKWFKTLSQCDFGGILGDEMGLGKTIQAIAYIVSEKEENANCKPSLIVCPTSLVYNWLQEFEKFAPTMKVLVISGDKNERMDQREEIMSHDVIITSYPLIRRDIEDYLNIDFNICIIDEAQHIKNPASLNAQSVKEIKAAKRFALTGTPIENSLTELWSIFDFIMPGYLKSHGRFVKSFESPIIKDKNENMLKELLKLIRPFILRRFKSEVAIELPPKIEHKVVIDMTQEQKKVYLSYVNSFKEEMRNEIKEKGFNRSKIKILSLLTRLRQICCDPSSFIDNYNGDSGKYIALEEILEESLANNHRILLFSQFTTILSNIRSRLDNLGISSMYLDGSIPSHERINMVNNFNNGEVEVFLISLKAGGTGLNLTGADMVIHFDPWWNPAVENQAVDRAHRIGQQKTVEVIKLIARGTIEEKINELQEKKKEMIKTVLDEEAHDDIIIKSMTEEEVEDLFKISF